MSAAPAIRRAFIELDGAQVHYREAGDAGCECDGWRGGGGWRRKNAGFGLIVGVAPVSRTMSSCTPSSTPSAAFGATADRGGTTSSPNEDDEDCERRVLLVVA